jgi:hypothetical protein
MRGHGRLIYCDTSSNKWRIPLKSSSCCVYCAGVHGGVVDQCLLSVPISPLTKYHFVPARKRCCMAKSHHCQYVVTCRKRVKFGLCIAAAF